MLKIVQIKPFYPSFISAEMLQSPMITEDVTELYDLISSSPLQEAYQLGECPALHHSV